MLQRGRAPGLSLEPGQETGLLAKGPVEELHRDPAVENRVCRRPDLAHAAGREALGQGVAVTQDGSPGGVHGFSTASMTWRAIGAATLPPVASLPASPPFSTTTATAIFGSSAGAKAVNQACGGPSSIC